jgi:hypothetical protein
MFHDGFINPVVRFTTQVLSNTYIEYLSKNARCKDCEHKKIHNYKIIELLE